MSESVEVVGVRWCDYCKPVQNEAQYDGRTRQGPWAFMCEHHFQQNGTGLGTGSGQRLIYREES